MYKLIVVPFGRKLRDRTEWLFGTFDEALNGAYRALHCNVANAVVIMHGGKIVWRA